MCEAEKTGNLRHFTQRLHTPSCHACSEFQADLLRLESLLFVWTLISFGACPDHSIRYLGSCTLRSQDTETPSAIPVQAVATAGAKCPLSQWCAGDAIR